MCVPLEESVIESVRATKNETSTSDETSQQVSYCTLTIDKRANFFWSSTTGSKLYTKHAVQRPCNRWCLQGDHQVTSLLRSRFNSSMHIQNLALQSTKPNCATALVIGRC
ncbi:hypothetical protein Y032_0039g94 [Ancylostoma ceylanicum]|uniref:Uncharacterized protein n=1 Tax=Ancylostoma ceylanicum TaxID=53326 RepID=A0A016UJ59_9BILA|nr:hypothetical protein Y032_0039g94 [Ancylostoma ceylanicum]